MAGRDGLLVRILGRLDACDGDAEIDLGGRRQRAVLAVLVLARGEIVPAERIADCLWGDDLPGNVSGAVQSYVSHLRRRLQPDGAPRSRRGIIASAGSGYALRLPPDAVDAWWFEQLVQDAATAAGGDPPRAADLLTEALELWRGPALSEYAGEPWAEAEIARLTELRSVARERLLAARLDRGEAALLVRELEALVADEPLREERWRLLVLALYRAHRQADALAALRRARGLRSAELGIDQGRRCARSRPTCWPSHRRWHSPRPDPAGRASRGGRAQARGNGAVRRPARPGRPRRRAGAIRHATPISPAGPPAACCSSRGRPGVGKTRLLAEARRLAAEQDLTVLGARGSQLEQTFGFGAVRQLFEPMLVDPTGATGC